MTHKTYEQRHDDPTAYSFKPEINKFDKQIFVNSPKEKNYQTKSQILKKEANQKKIK